MNKSHGYQELVNSLSSSISDKEFKLLRTLIYENFGIDLTEQKRGLIPGRLQGLLRKLGFYSFQQYYDYLISDTTGQALIELINHISTNHTFFYREKEHFDYFLKVTLPDIISLLKRQKIHDLRIWCAGCSTGEEPYMLLMLLYEFFGTEYTAWDAGILATDISEKVLRFARAGIYPEERISLLPKYYINKYFEKLKNDQFAVKDKIKEQVVFRRFNLMNSEFPFKKSFHAIFCRNVMIYFDQPTRDALVKRFYNFTFSGGYLFIGHSESLGREQSMYKYLLPAVYKKI